MDEALKTDIKKVMKDNPGYGHKRVALELKLNKKRILRVMKKFHLMPKRRKRKKFIKPDDLKKPESKYHNLIENFCPLRPNVVWVEDFTHLIEASLDAVDKRKNVPVYFHSDQGSEYESDEHLKLLEKEGIIIRS